VTEFAPHIEYRKERGLTDEKYNALVFTDLNALTTRSETGIASPSIRIAYAGLDGKPTGHRRWRLLSPSAPHKFHQLKGTDNHPFFPPPRMKSKKRWAQIAKDPKERIVIAEGEFKAVAAARAGLVAIGIGGVESWHDTEGGLLPELLLIDWRKRFVDLVPDADHRTNRNVRRGFLKLADALTEMGAVVRIRPVDDVTGTGKSGLDDYLVKYTARDFEKLTTHGMDSDLIKSWRQDLIDGSDLPDFDLVPLDPDWIDEPLPPLEFTVEAIIPFGTVVLMVAEGGVGKTHLALELVRAVASGDKFLGLTTRRGGVVYIALEDPPEILRRRVYNTHLRRLAELRASVDQSYAHRSKELRRLLLEHLRIVSLAGQELHLVGVRGGVVTQAPALDDLIERLRAERVELLILDPMARLHGTDENANATGTAVVNAAERIAREIGCTVIVLHHTGKSAANRDDQYAARGASGLADAARVVLRLRTLHDKEFESLANVEHDDRAHDFLKLIHAKCNYAPRFQDLWLKRNDLGQLVVFNPKFKDADDDHATKLSKLREWAVRVDAATFTRSEVKENYKAIFGCSRTDAMAFFDKAAAEMDLRVNGERKGHPLYEIAPTRVVADDD